MPLDTTLTARAANTLKRLVAFLVALPSYTFRRIMDLLRERRVESSAALALSLTLLWAARRASSPAVDNTSSAPQGREKDLAASDPPVLATNSTFLRYDTAYRSYPSIRTLLTRHAKAAEKTASEKLPILLFIHGLGGSLAQFDFLISTLSDSIPCFGIDFPGCGRSRFAPTQWDAYTLEALVELVRAALFKNFPHGVPQVIIVAHSMGCRIAQALARHSPGSHTDPYRRTWPKVLGVAAICPEDRLFTRAEEIAVGTVLSLPSPIFDLYRAADRRGGIDSKSVTRFAGESADRRTRELQLRFNEQSQTPVFRRMAWSAVRGFTEGASAWAKLDPSIHLLLIGGKDDHITPPAAVHRIEAAVKAAPHHQHQPRHVKAKILRGAHALLYDTNGHHLIAALVEEFVESIDEHLSISWQLQHSAGTKWDVKNLVKWLAVLPVSPAIGKPKPVFRALKTLRGVDDVHNPGRFSREWEQQVKAVIDISQDVPVYDPGLFKPRAIEYVKFATVSKTPPTKEQVHSFISLVDDLRAKDIPGWTGDAQAGRDRTIGVHCHYGFNRTGFLICAYLITRCGYSIEQALDEFAAAKPPGIKHEHFVDQLYLRYTSRSSRDERRESTVEFDESESPPIEYTQQQFMTESSQAMSYEQIQSFTEEMKEEIAEEERTETVKESVEEEEATETAGGVVEEASFHTSFDAPSENKKEFTGSFLFG